MTVLLLLLVFIIIAAVVAVESHSLISSVVSVGAVGLGLCIIFLILGAPEIAITQLVVEVLALIVLIRATIATSVPENYKGRELHAYGIAILFILIMFVGSFLAFNDLPEFGAPLMRTAKVYIEQATLPTGATNLVSAIILYFRKLDLVGTLAVIFAGVFGTLVILRPKGRKKLDERDGINS